MSKWIIFNADDFGLTPGVSRGIMEAHRLGVVRSTSLMPNLPSFEESVEMLKQCPNLDVGVHVNLTFGTPVSDPSEVRSLLDDSGNFWRKPSLLLESAKIDEMRKEIRLQIEKCVDAGLTLTHLDSHHHLHGCSTEVLDIFIDNACEFKLALRSINREMRQSIRDRGIPTPDFFNDDFYGEENITLERIENIIETMPQGYCEVMCHPGFIDEELSEKSSYNKSRNLEVKILTHPRTMQSLQKKEAKMLGYRDMLQFFPDFEK
ncbi:MAG: carbohydrate deacetylase [Candidatus Eremiobacteraeota bacterium]|nr:carbohydrate deacetylase [Candidatus Eremiobacteraeota bacterium]